MLVASFTTSVDGLTVTLADTSTPPLNGKIIDVEVAWGDGHTDGVEPKRSVSHTYPSGGTYSILETVTDSTLHVARVTATVTVVAPPPPPASTPLVASFSTSVNGLSVSLADTTAAPLNGKIIDVEVAWGDGHTDGVEPGRTVGHTYLAAGTYSIVETVTDSLLRVAQRSATVAVAPPPPPPPPPQWAKTAFRFQAEGIYRDWTGTGKLTKILKVKKKLGFPKRHLIHKHFVIDKVVYQAKGLASGGVAVPVSTADSLVDGIVLDLPVAFIGVGDLSETTLYEVENVDCVSPNLRIDIVSIVPVSVPGSPDERHYHLDATVTADIPWEQVFVEAFLDSTTLTDPYQWGCGSPPNDDRPGCNPAWKPSGQLVSFAAKVKGRQKTPPKIGTHTFGVIAEAVFPDKVGGIYVCPDSQHSQSRTISDTFAIFGPAPAPDR